MNNLHETALNIWDVGNSLHNYAQNDDVAAIGYELMAISKRLFGIEIQLAKLERFKIYDEEDSYDT